MERSHEHQGGRRCSVEGCDGPVLYSKATMCGKHWHRTNYKRRKAARKCGGCNGPVSGSKSKCMKCLVTDRRKSTCSFPGCAETVTRPVCQLCTKHYRAHRNERRRGVYARKDHPMGPVANGSWTAGSVSTSMDGSDDSPGSEDGNYRQNSENSDEGSAQMSVVIRGSGGRPLLFSNLE